MLTDRQTDRLTDMLRDRQTDRQAGRQADRLIDRQTDRLKDKQAYRQTDRQACRQTDRQTGRQTDRHRNTTVHAHTVFRLLHRELRQVVDDVIILYAVVNTFLQHLHAVPDLNLPTHTHTESSANDLDPLSSPFLVHFKNPLSSPFTLTF